MIDRTHRDGRTGGRERTATDRGVTDLIGFVLMFSIIIGGASVVYLVGFDTLEEIGNEEDLKTADRAMRGIAESFEDIHRQGVPSRSLEIGVDGASLDTRESRLRLEIDGASGPKFERDVTTNALVIERTEGNARSQRVAYESGALFRVARQGSIVRHRPVFSCEDDTAILSIVRLRGAVSVSVDDSVRITGRRTETERLYPNRSTRAAADELRIDVRNSRYAGAWEGYFDRLGSGEQEWEDAPTDGVYSCDVDRVYIRRTTIEVEELA